MEEVIEVSMGQLVLLCISCVVLGLQIGSLIYLLLPKEKNNERQ
jgi:hypothetical protein